MLFIAMGCATVSLAISCQKQHRETLPDDSDRLYGGTLELLRDYTDSIACATDSAAARSAFEQFNHRLDSLNFSMAPNTDLLLTEAENDTIFHGITTMKQTLEEKLYEFDQRLHRNPADSVA